MERLTFSAIWEMTPDADVVSVRFTKAVILSRAAMSYGDAQTRIDDPKQDDEITRGESQLKQFTICLILLHRQITPAATSLHTTQNPATAQCMQSHRFYSQLHHPRPAPPAQPRQEAARQARRRGRAAAGVTRGQI